MQRRAFITLLGGATAAWPLVARAQQSVTPVIGLLGTGSFQSDAARVTAVRRGLNEAGYVEGHNVEIEYRWGEDRNDRLPALADDLVRRRVNVIITIGGTPAALAAKAATAIIPVVFVIGGDPVQAGLVASLNRPGGNATGMTILASELAPKLLELLRELIPTSTVFALLINPTNPAHAIISRDVQRAADNVKLYEVHVLHASTERDFDKVFATLPQLRADGLVIGADPLFTARVDQLAALALRYKLPAIYNLREFAAAGGLVSYGTSMMDAHRLAGLHAGRILKGEKPAELPVLQSIKFEMVINLKTAKVLGLEIPPTLLARADQVIE